MNFIKNGRSALLAYRTGNIGDDVQSLSLSQLHLLGKPDLWVDRDQFNDYADHGPIDLVANGFFICNDRTGKLAFPPPPNFNVTYVALCASNIPNTPESCEHLKQCGPIGCRDHHTVKWCKNRNIDHYYASCPSMLLDRNFDDHTKENLSYDPDGPIVLVDVNPKRLPPFGVSDRSFICLTNRVHPGHYIDQESRFNALRHRLRILRSASLVITNRLHVAMPTMGMGVPVVMVEADSISFRLTALPTWLKIHKKDDLKKIHLDPTSHYTDEFLENRESWRAFVKEKLNIRLAV